MPLDATYDQLLRMLSARGLGWFKSRVDALPSPVALDHPDLIWLARAAQVAPVLTGLRGHPSPLEEIVARRVEPDLARNVANAFLQQTNLGEGGLARILLACESVGHDCPQWQLARAQLAENPPADLDIRLAVCSQPDASLLAEIEALLTAPVPEERLTEAHVDLFARTLMQLYRFGATRPRLSQPKIYGEVFANCLRFAQWGRRQQSMLAMAQMTVCLRLIDADQDVAELVGELISHQRPDGSFPVRAAYGTRDQSLDEAAAPSLMTILALHQCTFRRWRQAPPARITATPLRASRDFAASRVGEILPSQLDAIPPGQRLLAAASLSRATGENWFARSGLTGHIPAPSDMLRLAPRLFGNFEAVRYARISLRLDQGWADLTRMVGTDAVPAHLNVALDWLRGTQLAVGQELPQTLLQEWDLAAQRADVPAFHHCCEVAAAHVVTHSTTAIRNAARRTALEDLQALHTISDHPIEKQLARLDRLCLLAQIFEPRAFHAAAA